MGRTFKIVTNALIACLVLSALLHVVLFSSDSAEYKQWVIIQISLQVFGAFLLYYIRQYKYIAVPIFAIISIAFTFINYKYVNYSNYLAHLIIFPLFWVLYGSLIYSVRSKFTGAPSE